MNTNNSIFILIEDDKYFTTDDYKEVVKKLISKDYYDLPKEKRQELIKMRAAANIAAEKASNHFTSGEVKQKEIKDSYKKGDDVQGSIYTCDETAYILSLLNNNMLFMLERIDSHVLAKNITQKCYEKSHYILNTRAEQLLKNYLNRQIDDRDR